LLRSPSFPPILSVLLPTYNRAAMIMRAIESVLGQEFTDLELIVIDDGSTDETPQVVAKVDDKRLRYVYFEQNLGNCAARNQGIQQARGEFIAQIDSDDLWLPQKISYQYYLFQKYKHLDLICCNYVDLDDLRGTSIDNYSRNERAFRGLQVQELEKDAWEILGGLPEALLGFDLILHSSVMLRRTTLEMLGGYNENLRGGGDLECWWRAALNGMKFAHTSRILVERHIHGENLISDKVVSLGHHLQALQICEQDARDLGRNDLLPLFREVKYFSWHGIMLEQARRGKRWEAFASFEESIKYVSLIYGFSVVLFSYLFSVVMGPGSVERVKEWLGPRLVDRIRKLRPLRD
jgi:glycosyltransferase involved in cell wall biosynthesis